MQSKNLLLTIMMVAIFATIGNAQSAKTTLGDVQPDFAQADVKIGQVAVEGLITFTSKYVVEEFYVYGIGGKLIYVLNDPTIPETIVPVDLRAAPPGIYVAVAKTSDNKIAKQKVLVP